MQRYHDEEWGVPVRQERPLFELLCLEGAQAGLSWSTILARRAAYRKAFLGFDPERLAGYTSDDIDRLVHDPGIIRHRGKITSVRDNARAVMELRSGEGLVHVVWSVTEGRTLQPHYVRGGHVPSRTPVGDALAKCLKGWGFRFVGPTTALAFMQAAGLTNDHTTDCFRHRALAADSAPPARSK